IAGRDGLAPRRREARDDRAWERLVLGRLEDVCAEVVLVAERIDRLVVEALELVRRLVQRLVVFLPAFVVVLERLVEARAERAFRRADRLLLRRAEAERERRRAVARDEDTRVLDDVAVRRVRVRRGDRVVGAADETARSVGKRTVER